MPFYNSKGINLYNTPESLVGKTILGIGDSITENNAANGNKSWLMYLPDALGVNVINDGQSGTGLMKQFVSHTSFCMRVDGIRGSKDYVDYDTISPDVILIMGNGNDASDGKHCDYSGTNFPTRHYLPIGTTSDTSSDTTLYGALRHIFDKLILRFPLAKIGWIISTPRDQDLHGSIGGNFDDAGGLFDQYTDVIKAVCREYRIPVLDLYHNSSLRPEIQSNASEYYNDSKDVDGFVVHPNTKGIQDCMINQIIQWIIKSF